MATTYTALLPALAHHPGRLPDAVVAAALTLLADSGGRDRRSDLTYMLSRPEVTAAHTGPLVTAALDGDNLTLLEVVAPAHLARLAPGPDLDAFYVTLGTASETARTAGPSARYVTWTGLLHALGQHLTPAQRTYLTASPNLLAVAFAHLPGRWSERLAALLHIHAHLPTSPLAGPERALLVTTAQAMLRLLRAKHRLAHQTAVLSATTPETLSGLSLTPGGPGTSTLTTLEARHLVRLTLLPLLNEASTATAEQLLLEVLDAQGTTLAATDLTALHDHPAATPVVRARIEALRSPPTPDPLAHAVSTETVLEDLITQISAANIPWEAALRLLATIDKGAELTVDQTVVTLQGALC